MKNCLLLLSLLWLSLPGHAQEQPTRELKPLQVKSVALSTTRTRTATTATQTVASDSLAGETIAHCDAVIRAIDNKVEYVKSDQTMNEKALADGWFDKMARNRAIYVARKEALIARESGKTSGSPNEQH
jgi:hypothetical protein